MLRSMGCSNPLQGHSLRLLVSLRIVRFPPPESRPLSRWQYSRTTWEYADKNIDINALKAASTCLHEGYVNVAEQYGMSRQRGTEASL
jgi:hypothetical protein